MKISHRSITFIALSIALLTVCSYLSISIGFVPISAQTLAVTIIGSLLRPRDAFIATAVYLVMGLLGLPVFAGGSGGFSSVLKPTFGFLLSFVVGAPLMAWYLSKKKSRKLKDYIVSHLIFFLVNYSFGLIYMAFVLNGLNGAGLDFKGILMAGMIPFIPGDLLKNIISVIITKRLGSLKLFRDYYGGK